MTAVDESSPDTSKVWAPAEIAKELARTLDKMKAERATCVETRDKAAARIKWLNREIDGAERMTKAMIPRTRRTT
jgi:hypothetical protein